MNRFQAQVWRRVAGVRRAAIRGVGLAILACLIGAPAVNGATYYIDLNAPAGGTGGASAPFNSFRDAYTVVNPNGAADTLLVAGGVYNDSLELWSSLGEFSLNASLSVYGGYAGYDGVGGYDWSAASRVPRSTILDLNGANSRAFAATDETVDPSLTLDGLAFRNASIAGNGGAVLVTDGGNIRKHAVINDCLFADNAGTDGGALYVQENRLLTITNTDFVGNTASGNGGGLWLDTFTSTGNTNNTLANLTFQDNAATGWGGGMMVVNASNPLISRASFSGNSAAFGGGIAGDGTSTDANAFRLDRVLITGNTGGGVYTDYDTQVQITNAEFSDNTGHGVYLQPGRATARHDVLRHLTVVGNTGSGIQVQYHANWTNGNVTIQNSIVANNGGVGIHISGGDTDNVYTVEYNDVWNNGSGDYGGLAAAGTGSLNVDPVFYADTYQLQHTSPLLTAGANLGIAVDLLGAARPQGGGYTMGAYETSIPEPGALALLLGLVGLAATGRRRRRR